MTIPTQFHARFGGPIVIVGFGSIAQGVLPLLFRHVDAPMAAYTIVSPDDAGRAIADHYGIRFEKVYLTRDNLSDTLTPLLQGKAGLIINLSVDVSSLAIVEVAHACKALYIDTCIEPWAGTYTNPVLSVVERSNHRQREAVLAFGKAHPHGPTAVMAHGANPGLVSHFVKQALLHIARDTTGVVSPPTNRLGWAQLARRLGIKGIHIAERDTQRSHSPKRDDEFVNTWSIEGFIGEGVQPAELGWGTHEKTLPPEGMRYDSGSDAAIYLNRPGAGTRVRTWTPGGGPLLGYLITHNEAITIAEYLTIPDIGRVAYRPTVHYAYHPCADALLSLHQLHGASWVRQPHSRMLGDDIIEGDDELGVLLYGHDKNAYWWGSRLSIGETRALAPYQNATGLQVTAAVLAGVVWAIENPRAGVVEAEDIDPSRIMEIATPYLGQMVGAYTDWTPLTDRAVLFPEDIDFEDDWQFRNVIVR